MSTPIETPLLTDEEVAALVDKGLALHRAIKANTERLKLISEQLQHHALSVPGQHVRLVDEDREGTRFLAQGHDGDVVSIVCSSDLIMQTLAEASAELKKVQDIAGAKFPAFYKKVTSYVTTFARSNKFDGKQFRSAARSGLPDPEAFIAACLRRNKDGIPISAIKTEWI